MSDLVGTLIGGMREILREEHAAMREVVEGMSVEGLNWKPHDEANSICALLSHALDAEHYLIATAADVTVDRDRESHFRATTSGSDEMLALIDRMEQLIDGHLSRITAETLARDISRPWRTRQGIWWLLHASEHSREHVGQAMLTRQLYDAR